MRFSETRAPRLRLLVNGVVAAGAVEAEIRSNNHYASDRFRVAVALGAAPAPWVEGDLIEAEIAMSLDGGIAWTSLVQGLVDRIEIDPIGRMLRLDGRDHTAGLIEARSQESFANRTASEIAALLAARHGLAADVQATTTLVGRYWQRDHDRITLDQASRSVTEWDLLVMLAQHEGFDVWVGGGALHFRAAVEGPVAPLPAAGLAGLRLERSLTLARDIEVVVKSWNARQQRSFQQTARAARGGRRPPQRYVYVAPNLSPDTALLLAQRRLAELTRHERVISAEMPGDLVLLPRMRVALTGAGAGFDQIYRIDEVDRHVSVHGFTQHIRARTLAA